MVQIHDKIPRSGAGDVLGLLQKVEVQPRNEAVRQLGGDRAGLGADDQLSRLVLPGEDDVGEIGLHAAGAEVDRVQSNPLDAVRDGRM